MLTKAMASSQVPVPVAFPKSSLRDWRALLQALRTRGKEGQDDKLPISPQVRSFLESVVNVQQEHVSDALESLFSGLLNHFGQEFAPASLALCCAIVGVDPGESLPSDDEIPKRDDVDFEAPVRALLKCLREAFPHLDLSSEVRTGLTLLSWLQGLSRYVSEHSFPVPVTEEGAGLVLDLLEVSPATTEALIGPLSAQILFNIDGVEVEAFAECLVKTYAKLKQLPKIVSKVLMALRDNKEFKVNVSPLNLTFVSAFSNAVVSLPLGQIPELWKTLLYHIKACLDTPHKAVMSVAAQLFPPFLRHACVVDHTAPATTVEKAAELLLATQKDVIEKLTRKEDKTALAESVTQMRELALALRHNRAIALDEVLVSRKDDASSVTEMLVRSLSVKETVAKMDSRALLADLATAVAYLPRFRLLDLAQEALKDSGGGLRDRLLTSLELQENSGLQLCVLLSLVQRLWDELDDVDSVCQDIFKPVGKKAKELAEDFFESDEAEALLKKSLRSLENALSGDRTNPSLDAIYFSLPLSVLESLPLESLSPRLNLLACTVAGALLAVSTHEEESNRLIRVTARAMDPVYGQTDLFRYVNGGAFIHFLSRLNYHTDPAAFESAQRLSCQAAVKYAHEYAEKHSAFTSTLDRLAPPLENLREQERLLRSSVLLLEALEPPLTFRDASEQKLSQCEAIFSKMESRLLKGIEKFPLLEEEKTKFLVARALTSVVAIGAAKSETAAAPSPKKAKRRRSEVGGPLSEVSPHVKGVFEFLLRTEKEPQVAQRFFLVCLRARTALGDKALPKDAPGKVWRRFLDGSLAETEESAGLVEAIFKGCEPSQLTEILSSLTSETLSSTSDLSDSVNVWKLVIRCNLPTSELKQARRLALEDLLPALQTSQLGGKLNVPQLLSLLSLEQVLLDTEKPTISRECEGGCLRTCLRTNLSEVATEAGSVKEFVEVWTACYGVVSAGFHRRPTSLVIPRIPIVLKVVNNLLSGLVTAADQRRKVTPGELKEIVLCSHLLDRTFDQFRKHKPDFVRVSPFALSSLLHGLASCTLYPAVRANLVSAACKLLDVADKHGRAHLAATLPEGLGEMLKKTTEEYNQYHRYTGRV